MRKKYISFIDQQIAERKKHERINILILIFNTCAVLFAIMLLYTCLLEVFYGV